MYFYVSTLLLPEYVKTFKYVITCTCERVRRSRRLLAFDSHHLCLKFDMVGCDPHATSTGTIAKIIKFRPSNKVSIGACDKKHVNF